MSWIRLVGGIFKTGEFRVMENDTYSMKASFALIDSLVQDCRGILALEHTYVWAFMKVPLNRIYSVFDIPPFGYLGDGFYSSTLKPDRVDCVLVSHDLTTEVGCGTNFQIRYQNYIKPYTEYLQAMGASTYEIQGWKCLCPAKTFDKVIFE